MISAKTLVNLTLGYGSTGKTRKTTPSKAINPPLRTSPYRSMGPRFTFWALCADATQTIAYVAIVEKAKTSAIASKSPVPYRLAAKNAGMPSTMGDEPTISSSAVRADVS